MADRRWVGGGGCVGLAALGSSGQPPPAAPVRGGAFSHSAARSGGRSGKLGDRARGGRNQSRGQSRHGAGLCRGGRPALRRKLSNRARSVRARGSAGSAALRARLIARRRTRRESVSPRRSGRGRSRACAAARRRSEEHTSELQSLMRISYGVFCLKKNKKQLKTHIQTLEMSNQKLTRIELKKTAK